MSWERVGERLHTFLACAWPMYSRGPPNGTVRQDDGRRVVGAEVDLEAGVDAGVGRAGPLFLLGVPCSAMRGRCSSIVKRVVRSTRVPMAELSRPTMRSPSQ